MLTQELLHSLFFYDYSTGNLIWKIQRQKIKPFTIAGGITKAGYLRIKTCGKQYMVHRLVWLYHYGLMPENQIDHINGNRSDNRIENLRKATRSENLQNLKKARADNKSCGLLGVSRKQKRWVAQIRIDGKLHYLGTFDTPEEAHQAYLEAKSKLHPFQTIVSLPANPV